MPQKVTNYINKQKSPQKEICQELRKIIFETSPDAKEEMKWGVPAYADGKYYFVALEDHVNLGFASKDLPKAEASLLEGSRKTMKHLEIKSLEEIDKKLIVKLLKLINKK